MPPTAKLARANVTARAKRINKVTHAGAPPLASPTPKKPRTPRPDKVKVAAQEFLTVYRAASEVDSIDDLRAAFAIIHAVLDGECFDSVSLALELHAELFRLTATIAAVTKDITESEAAFEKAGRA